MKIRPTGAKGFGVVRKAKRSKTLVLGTKCGGQFRFHECLLEHPWTSIEVEGHGDNARLVIILNKAGVPHRFVLMEGSRQSCERGKGTLERSLERSKFERLGVV